MSVTETSEVSWTPILEKYFAETAERSEGQAWLHNRAEQVYNFRKMFVDLPVIIGSAIIGFLSAGSGALFNDQSMSSIALGIGSLAVGTINTMGSYFGWAKRAEGHRIAALSHAKLGRFLRIEMSLPRSERITANNLLKMVKTEVDRLSETSPSVPIKIRDEFKSRFKSVQDIAKPLECNGIHKVEIYSGEFARPFNQMSTPLGVTPVQSQWAGHQPRLQLRVLGQSDASPQTSAEDAESATSEPRMSFVDTPLRQSRKSDLSSQPDKTPADLKK